MEWVNYHHLLYFWVVAREGTLAAACERLRLAQPTVSAQLRALERSLGVDLFDRSRRSLKLTEAGGVVFRYADEIFSLGSELLDTVKGRPTGAPLKLHVGVVDVLPKLVVHKLLAPALHGAEPVQVCCSEGKLEALLSRLSVHELDVVLSDTPIGAGVSIKAFNHLLGECGITVFGAARLADRYRRGFPGSLSGAPWVLPARGTLLRRALDHWFDRENIHPVIAGEFEDSALKKVFGQEGMGLFAGPTVIEQAICRQYRVRAVGRTEDVREQFYAISMERRVRHPCVLAIAERARDQIFRVPEVR